MDIDKQNELRKQVLGTTTKLNSALSSLLNNDEVSNNDIVLFSEQIDEIKNELNSVRMCVVKEYLI